MTNYTQLLPLTLILLITVPGPPSVLAAPLVETDDKGALTSALLTDLDALAGTSFSFWQHHGVDSAYGGFYGTLDTTGKPIGPWTKGLVQTARHAWTFSFHHKLGAKATGSPNPVSMAQSAYAFLVDNLLDPSTGMFHWTVSRDGHKVVSSTKVLYGQWFGIYATATYGDAFSDSRAKDIAMACFKAVDGAWHNSSTGGYNHLLSNSIYSGEAALFSPVITSRSSALDIAPAVKKSDKILPTTLNDVLHGIEALGMLYKVSSDDLVKERLLELLRIICTQMPTQDGLIFGDYHPAPPGQQWTPTRDTVLNYGHMIEASWLASDEIDALLAANAISSSLAFQYQKVMLSLGAKAVEYGYDRNNGGFFDTGLPGKYPSSDAKVWWTQSEGSLGLWNLYVKGGMSNHAYLKMLRDTVSFISNHLNDPNYQEQYWQVESNGANVPKKSPFPGIKGNKWKASYHALRMLLLLPRRIRAAV